MTSLEFRLLGPLAVLADGHVVEPQSYRQRAVLATLLLEAGTVVGIDRLGESVWGQAPPPTARKQVQICVSLLRRLFEALGHGGLIRTRPAGYQLDLGEAVLDYHRFEHLRARARDAAARGGQAEAEAALREALGTWRGPALADLGSPFIRSRATWLEELRSSVYEEYVELRLRSGSPAELVGELSRAVSDQPTRERLYGYLMLALHRSGRRADALETYQQARRTLITALGVEPAEDLRRLHTAVLNDDPGIEDVVIPPARARAAILA